MKNNSHFMFNTPSLRDKRTNNNDNWDLNIFRHLDFNPLREEKTVKPKTKAAWPLSEDRHYSPLRKSIRLLTERKAHQQKQALLLRALRFIDGKTKTMPSDYYKYTSTQSQDYSNYLRRLKRKEKKEKKTEKVFKKSRENARNYYILQRQQAVFHRKQSFLPLVIQQRNSLIKKQKADYLLLHRHLQEERYALSLFYEDYLFFSRSKQRLKIDPMLHENLYKKRFLEQLHFNQFETLQFLIQRSHIERMLHFLWSLHFLYQQHREEKLLHLFLSTRPWPYNKSKLFYLRDNTDTNSQSQFKYKPYVKSAY